MASGIVSGLSWYQKLHDVKKCASTQQSDQSCFCTNTRTTHTRQNKPYRLGAVRAGVVGARDRCCPAATVPVAVVFPSGVCCCIAENIQNKIINRKTELCHHRPQTKAHSNGYENKIIVLQLFQNVRIFYLIFVLGLLPKIWGPLPDFGDHSPASETRPSRNMFSLE